MKLICILSLFITAECGLLKSIFGGTTRHDGLGSYWGSKSSEASAGFLGLKDCDKLDKLDKSIETQVPPVERKELPVKEAYMSMKERRKAAGIDTATGPNVTQNSTMSLPDLVPGNTTQHLQEKLPKEGLKIKKPEPPAPKKRAPRSVEGNLIESLKSMGGEAGEEAVHCVTDCRYGDARHEWADCLNKCVENPLMRSTFMSMLPKDNHDAHAEHIEMPEKLKERHQQRRRDRSGEL